MKLIGKVIGYFALAILLLFGWALAQVAGKRMAKEAERRARSEYVRSQAPPDLRTFAEYMNRSLPLDFDGGSRFERVDAEVGTLNYHFTMPVSDASAVGPAQIEAVRQAAVRNACSATSHLLAQNVTVAFHYYSPDGRRYADIPVTIDDCP